MPIGYLCQAGGNEPHRSWPRLTRPAEITVAKLARRWRWASASQFTVAYRRRFGVLPSHTLQS